MYCINGMGAHPPNKPKQSSLYFYKAENVIRWISPIYLNLIYTIYIWKDKYTICYVSTLSTYIHKSYRMHYILKLYIYSDEIFVSFAFFHSCIYCTGKYVQWFSKNLLHSYIYFYCHKYIYSKYLISIYNTI